LDGNTLQNAWLTVRAEADGTLTLEDRRSGQTYRKLLCFEDAADVGDGWCHSSPTSDRLFTSAGAPSQISLDAAGPELARLRIRTALMLPEKFDHGAMARSDALREFVIESHVTLRRDSDRVEVRVTVNNAVLDHRLRVLFPTGAKAETYFADSAFDVVERPIALPADNHLGRETAVETMPQQTWTAVSDASRGLAVVSTGLMESAVRDDAARTLALTLFRATRRTVFTDGECGGQLLGPMTFDFWLVPLSGAPDRKKLCNLGTLLAAGIRDVQLREADRRLHAMERSLPASSAFLQSVGNGVLTSCRWVGDALETRFFNPESADTTLVLAGSGFSETAEITAVDLESRQLAAPIPLGAAYSAVLPAKRIVTLAINTPPSC
jgi:alpha-mannosidase/mannosylglycerate hydrolase